MRSMDAVKRLPQEVRRRVHGLRESVLCLVRRVRRVEAVRWRSVASIEALLGAAQPSILWLHEPASLPPNRPLLFDELANEHLRAEHFRQQPHPTGVGIACLRNAIVSGSSLIGTSSKLFRLGPLAPLYVDEHLSEKPWRNELPVGSRKLSRRKARLVRGTSVVLTHWNSAVYGHWLLESLPKLLLLRRMLDRLPELRIVAPLSMPSWFTAWVQWVLPYTTLDIYDDRREYLKCESLLVPTLLMHPEHYFHPQLASLCDDLCANVSTGASRGRKLYVSRLAPSRFRCLSNQQEIESIAAAAGLTLVAPETLPLAKQVALFASADVIVGEFGSVMHNALFSAVGTKVLCLNWINAMQSRIAQLKGHDVGYLLPSNGVPITYVKNAPSSSYHIDPARFDACVRALVQESAVA